MLRAVLGLGLGGLGGLGVGLSVLSAPVLANEIDLGAPEGAERTTFLVRPADSYALPTGPIGRDGSNLQALEGRTLWSAYRMASSRGFEDVLDGYRDRLAALGFEPSFECMSMACGGFDFRFGVTVLPAPFMRMDVENFGQLSAQRKDPPAFASVLVSTVQGITYVQTVAVTPEEGNGTEVRPAPPSRAERAEDAPINPGDTRALSDLLRSNGHVAVDGLAFETGGTSLSASSAVTLDALARLLTRDAELNVVIVGHSDNVGDLDANISLSRRRADAVRAALVARGVPPGQLDARGVGYLAPLTSNATDQGRRMNRRVELVLRD